MFNSIVADAVSISLAGVSTIACIIALEVLLYYKMWHIFIYRLVLYMFTSLIIYNLSVIIFLSIGLQLQSATSKWTSSTGFDITLTIFLNGSLVITFMLMDCITVCIYLMALHNYQFTYKSDLCLLISSILYLLVVIIFIIVCLLPGGSKSSGTMIVYQILLFLTIPVNIVFTLLTLVPLCCRACGYNLCMKTAATIESHRKALREILPLFILIVPFFMVAMLQELPSSNSDSFVVSQVILVTVGLVSFLSFALHLCFIRKNLEKLRGKKRTSTTTNYGSVHQCRTHRTTAYTSEGISETCITEYLPVSESEEDELFILQNNNQVQ